MPIHFDTDPITGITQYFDYDPSSDKIHLTSVQDVSQFLEEAKNARDQSKMKGKVEQWAHYAVIPAIVEMDLAKKGIKLTDRNCTKKLISEIEANYPYLKVTNKHHSG